MQTVGMIAVFASETPQSWALRFCVAQSTYSTQLEGKCVYFQTFVLVDEKTLTVHTWFNALKWCEHNKAYLLTCGNNRYTNRETALEFMSHWTNELYCRWISARLNHALHQSTTKSDRESNNGYYVIFSHALIKFSHTFNCWEWEWFSCKWRLLWMIFVKKIYFSFNT